MTDQELKDALEKIFSADTAIYQNRGFQRLSLIHI